MDKKIYKFSYGSNFKKLISKIISLIYNFFVSIILLFILGIICSKINYNFEFKFDDNVINVVKIVEISAGVMCSCFFIIQAFLPQKVIINNNNIKIKRHCLFVSTLMILRGFNDTITIDQIKEIYRPISKISFSNQFLLVL